MKNNLKYFIFGGLITAVIGTSCHKKLDEVYANPNAGIKQPVELIFPSMIGSFVGSSSAAGSAYGLAGDATLIGRYVQYWGTYSTTISAASATLANFSNYDQMGGTVGSSDNLGSVWAAHYYGMGQNINRIIQWGSEEQKWDFVGAAWAIRAWSLLEATDEYGEIILKQAFNTARLQFDYDAQSEVYDSIRVICFRALDYLNMTGGNMNPTNFANSDFYFNGGSLDRWKKFVYGILARTYAYISNKSFYSADSVIKYCDLSCATNADNITCKFQSTGNTGTSNYFGTARQNVNGTNTAASGTMIRQGAYIVDLMTGRNTGAFTGVLDPRCWYFFRNNSRVNPITPDSLLRGITPWLGSSGLATVDQPESFIGTAYGVNGYPFTQEQGRYIFRDNAEWPIMTAFEMQFLKAEAAMRKNDKATALTAYTNAISLNFDMLSSKYNTNVSSQITPASKAAYMNNPAVIPASSAGMTLTRIMLQKYIAQFAYGVQETWADMRRYHYTNVDPSTAAQVYANFTPPSGTNLHSSNLTKLVYRCRPRYNSEYLYNIPALSSIGAYPPGNDYHTKECWFSLP